MRDVKEALAWAEKSISDDEDIKICEVKEGLGGCFSLDLQGDFILKVFRFGFYAGAHSKAARELYNTQSKNKWNN